VPFQSQSIQDRADKTWKNGGRTRITLHECRHTFASLMIAAGINAKTLQTYMGHSTITTTLDLYVHLFPEPSTSSSPSPTATWTKRDQTPREAPSPRARVVEVRRRGDDRGRPA